MSLPQLFQDPSIVGRDDVVEYLNNLVEGKKPVEAFEALDGELSLGMRVTQVSMLYVSCLLAKARFYWDSMDVSDQEPYGESFYVYASKKFGTTQASSTIDNYVNVARSWLLTPIDLPDRGFMYQLEGGEAKIVEEEGVSVEVPFNAWDIPYSKLLVATGRVNRGRMEEEDWGLLMNPEVTQSQFINHLRGPQQQDKPSRDALFFKRVSGWIVVSDGTNSAPIAELDHDIIKSEPLASQGFSRLRVLLNLKDEEEDF